MFNHSVYVQWCLHVMAPVTSPLRLSLFHVLCYHLSFQSTSKNPIFATLKIVSGFLQLRDQRLKPSKWKTKTLKYKLGLTLQPHLPALWS